MSRRVKLAGIAAIPVALILAGTVWSYWPRDLPALLPPPRDPALPDLAMPSIVDVYAVETVERQKALAFSATIANVGAGTLLIHAVRAEKRSPWRVSQRFQETGGSITELVTQGTIVYGGHGHEHWHLRVGASYWLTRIGSNEPLHKGVKQGFCYFDQLPLVRQPPQAPKNRAFTKDTCDDEGSDEFDMGMSPGWSDPYIWTLPDQRLDVTGTPDGVYRLHAAADPDNWFGERDETNNSTWVEVRLTTSVSPPRVRVLRQGPTGSPPVRKPGT